MGRFDKLFNAEANPQTKTNLLINQQTDKPTNQQASKEVSLQAGILVNQQTSKETNQQISKAADQQIGSVHLSTKDKKKYSTYLREDSILDIQVHSAQARKKDHELLQEIVDFYFKNQRN